MALLKIRALLKWQKLWLYLNGQNYGFIKMAKIKVLLKFGFIKRPKLRLY